MENLAEGGAHIGTSKVKIGNFFSGSRYDRKKNSDFDLECPVVALPVAARMLKIF